MWKLALLTFLAFLTVDLTQANACNDVILWTNNNQTCPPRAVCADVFDIIRNLPNGSKCTDKIIIHNCFCSPGNACPIYSSGQYLFASMIHKIYMCHDRCNYLYCPSIYPLYLQHAMLAMTTEAQSPEFNQSTFERIVCRCPRHHHPSNGYGSDHFSVEHQRTIYNAHTRSYQSQQMCQNSESDLQLEDPCFS